MYLFKHLTQISITLTSLFCLSTDLIQAASGAPLQAGVEHAEKLPPVQLAKRAGQKFDEKGTFSIEDKEWFAIPKWFAGTWRSVQRIRTSEYDCRSGETNNNDTILTDLERETFGYQQDRQQNIWTLQWSLNPLLTTSIMIDNENPKEPKNVTLTIYTFRKNQLISEDDEKVRFRTLDTVVAVRDNGKIESTELRETFRVLARLNDDTIAVQSDQQTYDQQGFPKLRNQISEIKKRDSAFKTIDDFRMTNILASFKIFLKDTNKLNLMPER